VLDADPDHPTPYLVVEYVDGPSLAEVITEQGPLTGGNLHSVAVGVAAALAAIHGAGVIHRDLKPRNVLFALGTPKVIDFGIAQALEATSHHTRADEMVGTLAYMAPERFDPITDRSPTTAADIFSWGAVVTYAGTGRTPFAGDTAAVTAARILTQPPRLDGLPQHLSDLVGVALAKDPADRPTASELLEMLLAIGADEARPEVRRAAEAVQNSGRYRTGGGVARKKNRRGKLIAGVTAAVLAAGALAGGGLRLLGEEKPAPPPAAAPAVSTAPPLVQGPSIFDPLTEEGEFQSIGDVAGDCEIDDGLVATTTSGGQVRCTSPDDVFPGSQSVGVTAVLARAGSCAAVWFRVVNKNAYRVTVCPGSVSLGLEGEDGGLTPLSTSKSTTSTGTPHRILLVSDGAQVTVAVDGKETLRAPTTEPALSSGTIALGAVAERGKRAKVTFTDAAFRSGTDPARPPVPGFATGSATFTARLWMLERGGGLAMIEPIEFVTGAEYCERHRIAASSAKCRPGRVADPSGLRVSMTTGDYQLLEFREGVARCTDKSTRAGTCPSTDDRFNVWATGNSPFPALVTTEGGKVVTVAQLDLP
jgi:eukaryotic-like serine/threonine-protein kinase